MEGTSAGAMRKALKAERGAGGSGKAALILLACPFRRQDMAGTAIALVLFQPPGIACDGRPGCTAAALTPCATKPIRAVHRK